MSSQLNNFILGQDLTKAEAKKQEARGARLQTIAPDMVAAAGLDPSFATTKTFNVSADEYRALTLADTLGDQTLPARMYHVNKGGFQRWLAVESGARFGGGYFSTLADAVAVDEGADNAMRPQFTAGELDADAANLITEYKTAGHSRYEAQTFASDLFLNQNPQAAAAVQGALVNQVDRKLEEVAVDYISANVAAADTLADFNATDVLDFAMMHNAPVTFCSSEAASVREIIKQNEDYGMNIKAVLVESGDAAEEAFFFAGDAVALHAVNGFEFMRNPYTFAAEGLVEFKQGVVAAPFIANPNAIVRYGA